MKTRACGCGLIGLVGSGAAIVCSAILLVAAISGALYTAYRTLLAPLENYPTTFLSNSSNGSTIEVEQGEVMQVILSRTPEPGHAWHLVTVDETLLPQVDGLGRQTEFTAGTGLVNVRFKATAPGETTLRLEYRAEGEEATPEDLFEVQIVIHAPTEPP